MMISVRRRFEGNTGTIGIDELKLELIKEIISLIFVSSLLYVLITFLFFGLFLKN